ncbi:MAG: hypothetical protein HQL32_15870, partial [Planctomycetes bacterium]|nr:hypothetical protein [Planctomycetota bacterium]
MPAQKEYVGRLAPSPTGALHLGNMRTFLVTWLHCRQAQGKLLMRMEDLNIPRLKEGAIQQVYDDLLWLGLDWDGGAGMNEQNQRAQFNQSQQPEQAQNEENDYLQTRNLDRYVQAFDDLLSRDLIYPCTCTRKDIREAQSAPHTEHELNYPGTCRGKWKSVAEARESCGREPAWRFKISNTSTSFRDGYYG